MTPEERRAYYRAYNRAYSKTPQRIAYMKAYDAARYQTEEYREKSRERKHRWRQTPNGKLNTRRMLEKLREAPEGRAKLRARQTLNYAIRTGKIKRQPCEVCGNPKSQAHHDDYSKPLVVKWRCALHHKQIHRERTKVE
jgi:hypothetical protein